MVLETFQLQAGYKKGTDKLLKTGPEASFTANSGDLIAFMGHNGIGKSTFLRTVAQLQEAISGNINLFGKKAKSFSRKEIAQKIAFVSTENTGQNYLTVFETVALGRYPYTNWFGTLEYDDFEIIERAIDLVNIKYLQHKPVSEISDGERQRTMIARAIAQDTQLVLMDEPTAFLDLQNKYQLVHLLSDLAHKQDKTIIFTTHDLNIALDEADKIWFFGKNKAIEAAPEEFIFNHDFDEFLGSHLIFDEKNFSIKRIPEKIHSVKLMGENKKELFYLQKAMERIGCSVNSNARTVISIQKDGYELANETEATSKGFKDIYQLCRFLRELQ